MFKVIDGQFTSIFKKTNDISAAFSSSAKSLNNFVDGFHRLNSQQNFGKQWQVFLKGANNLDPNLAVYFENLAKQGASAQANIQSMYVAMLDGNTRGVQNVRAVISTFNSLDPQNQQAFANAVGQTNSRLGVYLANLNGANASLRGYGTQLIVATAKTVALNIATTALNAILTMGISLAISALIGWISSWINAQQEAIEKARESAEAVKQETDAIDEYINKTIELRKKLDDKLNELIEKAKEMRETANGATKDNTLISPLYLIGL